MNKIPTICRFKNKLVKIGLLYRSPSALFSCSYGFLHRNELKCRHCPKNVDIVRDFTEGFFKGLQEADEIIKKSNI